MNFDQWNLEKVQDLLPRALSHENRKKVLDFWKAIDWPEAVSPDPLSEKLRAYQQFLSENDIIFTHNAEAWQPICDYFILYPPDESKIYFKLVEEIIGPIASKMEMKCLIDRITEELQSENRVHPAIVHFIEIIKT